MGNHFQKEENILSDQFEIENGLLGANRDVCMRLIELMTCKNDSLVRNLIGISGESVCWINHFHFTVARIFVQRHVERHLISSEKVKKKEITIKLGNIMFNLDNWVSRSILINILIKNTILECTIKINLSTESDPRFYVGICTPNQIQDVVVNWLGKKGYGCSFCFSFWNCYVYCFGNCSRFLKDGGIKKEKEEEITGIINNKNVNNKGGKMNIIRNQNRVPHTIVNIPKDGVHLGFSCSRGSISLSIISLAHVGVLPPFFNDGMKCIAYDFYGEFENYSFNQKNEEGEEVPYIREYYDNQYLL